MLSGLFGQEHHVHFAMPQPWSAIRRTACFKSRLGDNLSVNFIREHALEAGASLIVPRDGDMIRACVFVADAVTDLDCALDVVHRQIHYQWHAAPQSYPMTRSKSLPRVWVAEGLVNVLCIQSVLHVQARVSGRLVVQWRLLDTRLISRLFGLALQNPLMVHQVDRRYCGPNT